MCRTAEERRPEWMLQRKECEVKLDERTTVMLKGASVVFNPEGVGAVGYM